jgi:tetratricopeptide (TPR) repeat protein
MNKLLILLGVFICLAGSTAQSPFSGEVDSLILKGIDQTINCQFDSAENTYKQIIGLHPHHPVGYFYQATNLQSKMMDYETTLWEDSFYVYIDETKRLSTELIGRGDEDPWTIFFLGSAYSYQGLYQVRSGKILSGFINAGKAVGFYKKVLKMDPDFHDANMGLGNYKYWSGHFYQYLQWLPWIRDERPEGIEMVQRAVDHGTFTYWFGMNILGWMAYDRKEYEAALDIFQKGMVKYPESRFFLWGLADTYFAKGDYQQAVDHFEKLIVSIQRGKINNGYNETICRLKIGTSLYRMKQLEAALHEFIVLLDRKLDKRTARRLKKELRSAEDLKKQCAMKLGRVKVIYE